MLYVRETPNGKKQYINLAGFRPVTEEEISAHAQQKEQALIDKQLKDRKQELLTQIASIRQLLEQSDYKQSKWLDGALSEEEYAPIRTQRQEWRDEINRLEQELASL